MFIQELPAEVQMIDLGSHGGRNPTIDAYRVGSTEPSFDGSTGSNRSISAPKTSPATHQVSTSTAPDGYEVGQIVQHPQYGIGTVTSLSGHGALRKIKIRFAVGGEKTFIASKVQLKVVKKRNSSDAS
jgi:DNA helicase-2/ATP-dependent DNA helicase PcrA